MVIGRKKHGLKLIKVLLRQRLKLVIMTFGALKSEAQQGRCDDLLRRLQGRVAVDANFIRIAIAFAGTILSVSQIVSCDKLIDHLRGSGFAMFLRIESGQFIARNLLTNKLIKRLVGVDRSDDIVTILPGQRPIGVGIEVAIRVRVAGSIKPMPSPTNTVLFGAQVTFDHVAPCFGGFVSKEVLNFRRSRRQSRQDKTHAPNQGASIGGRTDSETNLFQFELNELIDRGATNL